MTLFKKQQCKHKLKTALKYCSKQRKCNHNAKRLLEKEIIYLEMVVQGLES